LNLRINFIIEVLTHSAATTMSETIMNNEPTFTLFSQLPIELRLKIWHHALPLFSRVLELKPVHWNDTTFPETVPWNFRELPIWNISISTSPILLQVNAEARYELLPRYFNFLSSAVAPSPSCQIPGDVSFCPEADTLYINLKASQKMCRSPMRGLLEEVFGEKSQKVKKRLRTLAGSERFWVNWGSEECVKVMGEFENLVQVIMVVSLKDTREGNVNMGTLDRLFDAIEVEKRGKQRPRMSMCTAARLEFENGYE
jgi:hypothetical protein